MTPLQERWGEGTPIEVGGRGAGGVCDLPSSGPKLSPDSPFWDPIGAQFGPRLKTSPNKPYFGNRAN